MLPFERLESLAAAFNQAASVSAVVQRLASETQSLGFERFAYVELRPRAPATSVAGSVYVGTYPREWSRYYGAHGLHRHDPVWSEAARTIEPFLWADVQARIGTRVTQRLVNGPAADAGLRSGGGIPLHGPAGMVAGFQVANDCEANAFRQLFVEQRHLLQFIAWQAHARMIALTAGTPEITAVKLSPRRQEVLLRVMQGKTNAEIGDLLGVKEDTVRQHIIRICDLLGAFNRTQAAMIARERRLIAP